MESGTTTALLFIWSDSIAWLVQETSNFQTSVQIRFRPVMTVIVW